MLQTCSGWKCPGPRSNLLSKVLSSRWSVWFSMLQILYNHCRSLFFYHTGLKCFLSLFLGHLLFTLTLHKKSCLLPQFSPLYFMQIFCGILNLFWSYFPKTCCCWKKINNYLPFRSTMSARSLEVVTWQSQKRILNLFLPLFFWTVETMSLSSSKFCTE